MLPALSALGWSGSRGASRARSSHFRPAYRLIDRRSIVALSQGERGIMTAPSLITARRFSHPLRLRLQVLFAKAFEALADTYRAQATEFVHRLRGRMTVEDALDRYFREVGVPQAMEATVRSRALISLAPTARDLPEPETRAQAGWTQLRPDQVIDALR